MEKFSLFFSSKYTINAKGEILLLANRHRTTVQDVFNTYRDVREKAFEKCEVTLDQVQQYISNHTPKETSSSEDFDLGLFIIKYLQGHKDEWRIDSAWRTIETLENGIPVPSDIGQLQNAIRCYAIKTGLGKYAKPDDIKVFLADFSRVAGKRQIARIMGNIAYDPNCIEAGNKFLQGLHRIWGIRQSYEVFSTIMRHWLWQVKRKLMGNDVVWPLWVNFYGGSSLGKTTMLNDMAKPFDDFAIMTNISELLDEERQIQKLTTSYIINIDELSVDTPTCRYSVDGSITKGQQAALKRLLTQKKSRTRIMGGQNQSTRRYTFSVCSSANEHLPDIMYDEKTMRRYFEFVCTAPKIDDYNVLDELKTNILPLWKSVDENLEDGYWHPKCSVWDETRKEQDGYYPSNTTTQMWVEEVHIEGCDAASKDNLQDLYEQYKTYCKEKGHNNKSYANWLTDIRHVVPNAVHDDSHVYIRLKPEV